MCMDYKRNHCIILFNAGSLSVEHSGCLKGPYAFGMYADEECNQQVYGLRTQPVRIIQDIWKWSSLVLNKTMLAIQRFSCFP